MNTDGIGLHTCKECHETESLWNHTTTDHKKGEQLEGRRSFGVSSCNSGDGTDQRVQSLMFMMMMCGTVVVNPTQSYSTSIAQYVLHLNQCTHGHVWKWNVTVVAIGLRGLGEMSIFKYRRILSFPKIKIWRSEFGRMWGVSRYILIWTFLLVLMLGIHSWSLSKHFRHILYSHTQVSLLSAAIKWRRAPTCLTGGRRPALPRFMTI